jgi:hypothetical protein
MHVWRYDLGSWIEVDVTLAVGREFPQGFEHPPFMALGDVSPQARRVSAAVHESTQEGGGYLVIVFGSEEAFDPVLVRDFSGLVDLLAKLAASSTPPNGRSKQQKEQALSRSIGKGPLWSRS